MQWIGAIPVLALLCGAACSALLDLPGHWLVWGLPPLLAAAAGAWWRGSSRLTIAAVSLGFCVIGVVLAGRARDEALHSTLRDELDRTFGGFALDALRMPRDAEPVWFRAVIVEDAARRDDVVSLRTEARAVMLKGEWRPVTGGVRLSVAGAGAPGLAASWTAGRSIEAPVVFRRPARYLNDGVPDFERDLALDGTTLFGSIKSGLLVEIRRRGRPTEESAAAIRAWVRSAVDRRVARHDSVSAAIVTALLIGDRSALPDEIRLRLQAAGTYHVIAISGGNIAILAGLTIAVLFVVGIHGRIAALVAIAVLIGYAHMVVSGPSVWRATVMAVAYFTARLIDHRTAGWHATGVAAVLLVIAAPLDVREPGFLLTFGATGALLEAARRGRAIAARRLVLGAVAAVFIASAATETALLPVSAAAFSRVTSAGLLLNILAVPLMSVVQVAGMAVALLDRVEVLAVPAGWIAHLGAASLVGSARLVDVAPWLSARVPPPGPTVIAIYYGALLTAVAARTPLARSVGSAALLATAVLIVRGVEPDAPRRIPVAGDVRLTVFDVGQGDAMLVQAATGASLLVDTGGVPFGAGIDIGRRVLSPAMWARGVRRLDALLVTHGDPDHMGGAAAIIEDFAPRHLNLGVPVPRHLPTQELLTRAVRMGTRVEQWRSGKEFEWSGVRVRVLNPPDPEWERQRVRNDDSIVVEIRYGDVAMLLTGDISADIERAILPNLSAAPMRILKVAHHGSRTSSSTEFLETWRPQIAVISSGRANRFGHPVPEVVARLDAIGAQVWRTDLDGEVTIDTNGKNVRVRSFQRPVP